MTVLELITTLPIVEEIRFFRIKEPYNEKDSRIFRFSADERCFYLTVDYFCNYQYLHSSTEFRMPFDKNNNYNIQTFFSVYKNDILKYKKALTKLHYIMYGV